VHVDDIDGSAHVEQVSVEQSHQAQGAGRALIERVSVWTTEQGMPAITSTTFTDVPWNAPLSRCLGFRVVADEGIGTKSSGRPPHATSSWSRPSDRTASAENSPPDQTKTSWCAGAAAAKIW
jgi:hypothetical protein